LADAEGDPTAERMHAEEAEAAAAREAREDAAAQVTRDPEGKARLTPLAQDIPRPPQFEKWFDSLTPEEFEKYWRDEGGGRVKGARQVIARRIRDPGDLHEWLMVAESPKVKKWGVSMQFVKDMRTLTRATQGPKFRHGGPGSGTMHLQLRTMIQESGTITDFLERLNAWADRELSPSHSVRWPIDSKRGRYSLPDGLQLPGEGANPR
jgi:hypothetical protein